MYKYKLQFIYICINYVLVLQIFFFIVMQFLVLFLRNMEKYIKNDFIGNVKIFILIFMVILILEENFFYEEGLNFIDLQSLLFEIYGLGLFVKENEICLLGENL